MTSNFEINVTWIPPKKPEIKLRVHIPLHPPKKPKIKIRIRIQPPKKPKNLSPNSTSTSEGTRIPRQPTPLHLSHHQRLVPCYVHPSTMSSISSKPQYFETPWCPSFHLEATCWSRQIRESIEAARSEFIKMMYVAKSQSQTTAAAATFIKQIDCWIMELWGLNLHQNLFLLETQIQKSIRTHDKTPSCKPNVQRRQDALERFEREPWMVNLPPVHAAL
jgi:hypothetical protein